MSNSITYKQLFNLNVFHNYFLDNSTPPFDNTKLPEVFSGHNVKNYLHLKPSFTTEKLLSQNKLLFKATTSGATCLISVDEDAKPKRDLSGVFVDFLIYTTDPLFGKYTEGINNLKDVYYFSNHAEAGIIKLDEDLSRLNILSENATSLDAYKVAYDVTKDSAYEKLTATLTPEEQQGLLGVVSIKLEDLLDANKVPTDAKEFKILFSNRKTSWVYVNQSGVEQFRVLAQPFVKKGKISITNADTSYRMATPSDQMFFPEGNPIETKIYI